MDSLLYTVQICGFPTWSDTICLCKNKTYYLEIFPWYFFYLFGCCSEMQCRCPVLVCFIKIMSRWVEAVELLHVKKLLSPSWVLQANPPVCVLRHTSTCTHAAKVILEVAFFINKEAKNSNRSPLPLCSFSSKSIWISFRWCGKFVLLISVNSKTP